MERAIARSQIAIARDEHDDRREPLDADRRTFTRPPPAAAAPPRAADARRAGAAARAPAVTSSKKRGSSRVSTVRGAGRSIGDDPGDPARTRAHHDDAGREEDRLGDRVRDEHDRRRELLPDREQLEVQALARHLVERAERLVHQQQRRLEGERARDRDALLHPARELPRVVVAEAAAARPARASRRRVPCAARGPSRASRAAARCSWPPCASRTAPRPGRRSRSRGRLRAWCAGLPLIVDRPRARARSGRRSRAAASTCRSPTGRSARRTRPARSVRSMSWSAVTLPRRERLRDAARRETTGSIALTRAPPARGGRRASRPARSRGRRRSREPPRRCSSPRAPAARSSSTG